MRGVGAKGLNSNTTSAEGANDALGILSFDEDGFSFSSDAGLSQTNAVAWCWRAGAGTTSTNTDGSIQSVVSVNQTAGSLLFLILVMRLLVLPLVMVLEKLLDL